MASAAALSDPDQDRMKNAVAFLQHPKVGAAPLQQKVSFLEKKGLTKEEICRAFRQLDPNSPDAAAIEKGAVVAAAPIYTTPPAAPVMYYPYPPPAPPSRLPLYSALASVVLAAGGGLAYLYRHAIAEKLAAPAADSDRQLLLETARANQTLLASLQRNADGVADQLAALAAKVDLLAAKPKPPITDRPETLSPAVQALLEGTPSVSAAPSTTFDVAAATAALDRSVRALAGAPEVVAVLRIYIKNLAETGAESTRFHRISVASPTYEQKVAPYPSAIALLEAVGFRRSDGFLVWQAPMGGADDAAGRRRILATALERLSALMEKAEPPSRDDDDGDESAA